MNDSLQVLVDSLQIRITTLQSGEQSSSYCWWMLLALAELLLIGFLFLKLKKSQSERLIDKKEFKELKSAKDSDVDMDNLMNSITSARELYKKLSRVCHPDRFHESAKKEIAEELFQEISRDRRNYGKLKELQAKAESQLQIKL